MVGKSGIIWTMRELTTLLRERQHNKFDCNIGVSGKRGDGKSTFLYKLFHSFKKEGFKQEKHQVYSQDDVKKLLSKQNFSFCWDDEAINSGYKRDFQKKGQQELIKIVTNYRDNFNIYGSAIPFFYSLDKDLRELIFMHVHIKERGVGVIFLPLEGQIHSQDPWDTKRNAKIEERENKRLQKNPKLKFRYHKLSTFAGFIYFGDLTKKQREKYLEIKRRKRKLVFENSNSVDRELSFEEKVYNMMIEGKMTRKFLKKLCLMEGKKYYSVLSGVNARLTNNGINHTSSYYLDSEKKETHSNSPGQISSIVPSFSS